MVRLHDSHELMQRYLGWDILKLASYLAIIIFHFQLIVWYSLDVPDWIMDRWAGAILRVPTEAYARMLSFSGFTIVFLAGMNQGQTGRNLRFRRHLYLFLVVAWVIFSLLIFGVRKFYLAWDVYPLLFTGLFTAMVIQGRSVFWRRTLGILGVFMLFIPFWHLEGSLKVYFDLQHILVGNCEHDYADWPIFPWIGLVWFGYACGAELCDFKQRGQRYFNLSRKELAYWLVFLALSVNTFGPFYNVNLGRGFACEVFRFPWDVFWGHFIWPIFVFRISLDSRVQDWLVQRKVVRWLASLSMVRNFWLSYLVHFAYIHLLSAVLGQLDLIANDFHFAILWVSYLTLIPVIEYLSRLAEKWFALVAKRYQSRVS